MGNKMEDNTKNYIEETISKTKTKCVLFGAFFILLTIYIAIKQSLEEKEFVLIYVAIFLFIVSILFLLISYYFGIYKKKKFMLRRDKILQNGIHVVGKIISKERVYYSKTSSGRMKIYYYVRVKFNNNKEIIIDSPWLNFHPDYITSDLVDVYIYNNEYYITNYRLDTESMLKNKLEYKNDTIKKVLLISLIMPVLFLVLIYFYIKKLISPETFAIIFMGSFLGIGIYDTIKKIRKSFKE